MNHGAVGRGCPVRGDAPAVAPLPWQAAARLFARCLITIPPRQGQKRRALTPRGAGARPRATDIIAPEIHTRPEQGDPPAKSDFC